MGTTYKQAGVDIEAGDALVERIKPFAARTRRKEVISGVGGFGGLFAIPPGKYKEPVLVSGTDGVGTKLKLAFATNQHSTIGIDLVAMSVNDIITSGAEPLFFLDYFATSGLDVAQAAQVIAGIARGCEESGCTLLGGETAELPGFYQKGEYDLAGFAVGVVERSKIIDGSKVQVGDALVGMASSGLHSNGYSLARKVLIEQHNLSMGLKTEGFHRPLGEELLEPTRIYVRAVMELCAAVEVRGLAHITGSGIPGNLPRCLPDGTKAVLEERSWPRPPIFEFIAKMGDVASEEMYSTFNMGLGMIAVVPQAHAPAAIRECKKMGVPAWEVGRVEKGAGEATAQIVSSMRVAVLVSGSGTNLQALIDAARAPGYPAEIAVVVSNVPTAYALERAKAASIPTAVIPHGPDRAAYDQALLKELAAHRAELVCLAGFMRLLGPEFLAAYRDRVINIHPALLPAFPGMHAVRQALQYGAKVSGCTVHFVDEGTDTGPVIAQAVVPVLDGDDEKSLGERIHAEEHKLYPRALRLVAEGRTRIEGRSVRISQG